ncbi:plasminogen activator sPA-like protein, partial [Leptotrombidium deliense]
ATANECGKSNPVRSKSKHYIDSPNNYIIGGRKAIPGEFPWQVAVKNFKTKYTFNFCGGVIWNSRYILTAAHCLLDCVDGKAKKPTRVQVCVGDYNLKSHDGENCANAVYWWTHEKYDVCSRKIKNDIGILKLKYPLYLPQLTDNGYGSTNIPCHPKHKPYHGMATISGWGRDNPNTKSSPDVLKALTVPIWTNRNCKRIWNVDESQICVGGDGVQSSCQGDSGGPLVYYDEKGRATVIGLTSYGPVGCLDKGVPTVFTRISYYLDWIYSITNSTKP